MQFDNFFMWKTSFHVWGKSLPNHILDVKVIMFARTTEMSINKITFNQKTFTSICFVCWEFKNLFSKFKILTLKDYFETVILNS